MKKIFFIIILFNLCFGIFAQSGVIRSLSGTVEIKHRNSPDYITASAGDVVNEDTIIHTGFRSTAIIEIGSTVISVRALTRLTLTEIRASAQEEQLDISLQSGRVRVEVNPPSGTRANMTVRGPSSVASVRGTIFEFTTNALRVEQGTVIFQGNRGYAITVNAGASSVIEWNNTAGASVFQNEFSVPPIIGLDPSVQNSGSGDAIIAGTINPNYGVTPIEVEY